MQIKPEILKGKLPDALNIAKRNRANMTKADLENAMQARHSVRAFTDEKIDANTVKILEAEIQKINAQSGLHIQLVTNEPQAFSSKLAHYGSFSNVTDYICLIGKKSEDLEELCGYYGEKLVLLAQHLGLNTCWVGLTYSKSKAEFTLGENEKLAAVIALGYGKTRGVPHKSKPVSKVVESDIPFDQLPVWFEKGVKAALLAPTAVNQQKFKFSCKDGKVTAKPGIGFFTKMDLGIAKYHFEAGADKENFEWSK
jgi:hypothetical protein